MSEVTYNRVNWKDTPSTETPINATNLNKMDKGISDVAAAVNECFQSASEGKTLIAAALTGKGQASTVSDTYAQMAAKIGNLMAVPTATKNITSNGNNIDVTNYAKVNVNVNTHPTPGFVVLRDVNISSNQPTDVDVPAGYSRYIAIVGMHNYNSSSRPTVTGCGATAINYGMAFESCYGVFVLTSSGTIHVGNNGHGWPTWCTIIGVST